MKVGIYIDAANISSNGGYAMRYDILKHYCIRENNAIRLNTYIAFDDRRAENDLEYRNKQLGYFSVLRSFGFKVITKQVRHYENAEGDFVTKANVDIDIAVDLLKQSAHLDKVYLFTGDGDFKKVITAAQDIGARVEVVAFSNVSRDLIREADYFNSGYLIPNLVPVGNQEPAMWGLEGYQARGQVYNVTEGYGFIRFLDQAYRYKELFFHFSQLPEDVHVRLDDIFQFKVYRDPEKNSLQATEMELIRT